MMDTRNFFKTLLMAFHISHLLHLAKQSTCHRPRFWSEFLQLIAEWPWANHMLSEHTTSSDKNGAGLLQKDVDRRKHFVNEKFYKV